MSEKTQKAIDFLYAWIAPAARAWYADQCRNEYEAYYFYYKPSTKETPGALAIATEPFNEEWKLADPQRVSPAWTMEQTKQRFYEIARRLPVLPWS